MSVTEGDVAELKEFAAGANAKISREQESNFDSHLFALVAKLPTRILTQRDWETGGIFTGYLYSPDSEYYVNVDVDGVWLYTRAPSETFAVIWNMQRHDRSEETYLRAADGRYGNTNYFNYRNLTGACKLYDSYVGIVPVNWSDKTFCLYVPGEEEYVGLRPDTDRELYVRADITPTHFSFKYYNFAAFTVADRNIYSKYLKWRADQA